MHRIYRLADGHLDVVEGGAPSPPAPATSLGPNGARVWIEVEVPTPDERAWLVQVLGLHEIALEEALRPGTPPKLDDYGEHVFLIAHTPARDGQRRTRKIALFLGRSWIATVVRAPLTGFDAVRERVRRDPAQMLGSPDHLAHAILDHMSTGFEQQVDLMIDRAEALEDAALERPTRPTLAAILALRREHKDLLRVVRGQRDVLQALGRSECPVLTKRMRPYFRGLADHVMRLYELLDDLADNITSARDAYLVTINNRLSDVMRVLTVIATIMLPLTLVTGIYGMNFESIPGLKSPIGFWSVIGAMTALAAVMLALFRRRGWL